MPETVNPDGFRLADGVLRCPYDMNPVMPKEFRSWCEKLLEFPEKGLTVDLSQTRHVSSHHLGILAEAWTTALEQGRDLVLVISPGLKRIFELSGFDKVFKIIEKPRS